MEQIKRNQSEGWSHFSDFNDSRFQFTKCFSRFLSSHSESISREARSQVPCAGWLSLRRKDEGITSEGQYRGAKFGSGWKRNRSALGTRRRPQHARSEDADIWRDWQIGCS